MLQNIRVIHLHFKRLPVETVWEPSLILGNHEKSTGNKGNSGATATVVW